MNSEEEDERVDMTPEELQHWVREQVEKNEQLVQRQAQLVQVEEWVKRKEREATYTQLVYNNAFDSVLKCESLMKGLYGMLGLEYRDTDSEEEGADEPIENVPQTTDNFDHVKDGNDCGAAVDGDDDYVVIDLGASVPETSVKEELKEVGLSADMNSVGTSVETFVKVKKMEDVDLPSEIKPTSTLTNDGASDNPLTTIKTLGSPIPISEPPSCDLPAQEEGSPPVSLESSIPMNETVETPPPTTIPDTASASTNDTNRLEKPSETSAPTTETASTEEPVVTTPTATLPVKSASKSSNTCSTDKQKLSSKCKKSKASKTSAKKNDTQASPKPSRTPSSTSTPSKTTVQTQSTENAKSINPKQGDNPEDKSPTPSCSPSGTSDSISSDKTSNKTTSTKQADPKEAFQNSPTTPAASTTPTTTATPVKVQKEVTLKVNMSVLGRRRTKTWHQGTILDIKTTESGPRYKILFDNGKGKSVLSAHHLACVNPPMLKDLFVGCRVVACYREDKQSWLHAAVVAEMPDRRNRMRFLVFFDDSRPAYIALPDLHLVCKPMSNMSEDIEDEVWRAELDEYLQAYPNPVFVVMRVGQDSVVERGGQMEECTVTQLDGSLIQVCYRKEGEKEWLYKGSNRLEQIQKIKKRIAEQKEQDVNKDGRITPQKGTTDTSTTASTTIDTPTTTTTKTSTSTTKTSTTTAASQAKVTTNAEPLKTSPASNVPQIASPVPTLSNLTKAFEGHPISQPKIVLNRIAFPSPLTTVKTTTHPVPLGTTPSNTGTKRPSSEEEDNRSQNALLPVVEPRLKYVPHRCCPACLYSVRPIQKDQHRGQNPLLIPLLHGFRRMTARRRLDGKMSFQVFYRAPCGRSMCAMEEVQAFLFESRCDFLFLDMFCLDPFVLVKRALLPSSMVSHPRLFLPDISGGKEAVPVPCVNELNDVSPPTLTYTSHRLPASGVFINNNLDFMVGCDCTDGCRDRTKCACYQMTIEATSLFTGGPVDVTAGYTHKRLQRYVPTGVYECNAQCRCDPWLCGNRLVQHGLQLRLEVFMTQHKGWGLRCLDDMSKGTFVCVFTGKVVDETSHGESALAGNEYLLNLDYIEGVEKLKEGYESEAYCSETESEKKTLVTMTTGALQKHRMFQVDSSSSCGEEKVEATQQKTKTKRKLGNKERKARDVESEDDDDDIDDEDYKISSNDDTGAKSNRSYTTRRKAKIPESPGRPKTGFAKKSTRSFAIKSSHRRVKPLAAPEQSVQEKKTMHDRKCTRSLFNGEKSCYLIDAKHEGNLARFINHSCNPNLFVQNVFVDTHDLRFPWVAFFTSKRIRAGTELMWDYSYEVGSVEGKVLLCCCGSAECSGRLL
ncbi:histone-lysine N-methyltransferase SETDB1-A [Silurus meridionalis]|nr:histone-lysine N-methyltransferase SETDB1-A [Silurus meridionalis]